MLRKRVSAVVILASVLVAGRAHAVFIDFESVPGLTGAIDLSSPVPAASQLSTQLQLSLGVSFSSAASYVGLARLGNGHATSGVNGIGGVSAAGLFDYREAIITFTLPGDPSTPAVTNFASIRGDHASASGSITLEAFDVGGFPLASVTIADGGGSTLSLSPPGMHRLRVTSTSGTVAFDDLQFNTPVPEPASAALLGVGLALLAWARRGAHRR